MGICGIFCAKPWNPEDISPAADTDLPRVCCGHSCVCAKWALSAWGWDIATAPGSPLEEEPVMASKRRALRVWPLALEHHTKLAAVLGHAVIEHLQSWIGRDINTFRLYTSKWFWGWFTSWNCPSVPLVGGIDLHPHAQHEMPWCQRSWFDLHQQIILKFIGQLPKHRCSYTEMCLKDWQRRKSSFVQGTNAIHAVQMHAFDIPLSIKVFPTPQQKIPGHGSPWTALPQYV